MKVLFTVLVMLYLVVDFGDPNLPGAVSFDPDDCVEHCKRYAATGCDILLCLLNPYKIPHEKVMQSIELIGKHVIPEFA